MSVPLLLSTESVPPRERVGYWGDLVQRSFGRLRSQTFGDETFHGEIRGFQLGELRVCRLNAARHRVERTSGAARASDPGYLKMVVQRRGYAVFEQDGAGFSSAAHFSRMFRQHYGASPREWRRRRVPHGT